MNWFSNFSLEVFNTSNVHNRQTLDFVPGIDLETKPETNKGEDNLCDHSSFLPLPVVTFLWDIVLPFLFGTAQCCDHLQQGSNDLWVQCLPVHVSWMPSLTLMCCAHIWDEHQYYLLSWQKRNSFQSLLANTKAQQRLQFTLGIISIISESSPLFFN